MSVTDVSEVLVGTWNIDASPEDLSCVYADDAGPFFVTTIIPVPAARLDAELQEARSACTDDIEDLGGRPVAFQCHEVNTAVDADLINGSVVAKGRLWLVTIPAADTEVARASQLDVMRTLLTQALGYQ